MVKSKEITIQSDGKDMQQVFEEAESFADSMKFKHKEKLHFRLLVEETMGMLRSITGELSVKISFLAKDDEVVIHLETFTTMDLKKREDLLSVSSTGKNESAKGIMGKVREAFEFAFIVPDRGYKDAWMAYGTPAMTMGMPDASMSMGVMDATYWSLARYKESLENNEEIDDNSEEWDELEKSIVSKLSNDIRIGIKGGLVVMDVVKKDE